ncbi:MAG: hypothetical protein HC913_18760 [Microscillaceae bacterium]|nr:hypothetical protein [Microscillaceae bacterium]
MNSRFIAYLNYPARWGVSSRLHPAIQKHVILCNLMSWVIVHFNTAYLLYDAFYFGLALRSLTSALIILLPLGCLWLNRQGYTFVSRLLSSFMYAALVFFYGLLIKFFVHPPDLIHYLSPRIPLIMFVFFPFLFLDFNRERAAFWGAYLLNIAYVVLYDPLHTLLGIDMAHFGLYLKNYGVMTQNSITFLINISMSFAFLLELNRRYERRIRKLNKKLRKKNARIFTQNETLTLQKEEILALNNHLEAMVEERTQKLSERNQQLADYAFWNAHKLRAPVASILGLFEVMQLEENRVGYPQDTLMLHLFNTVKALDQVIKHMQVLVEEES